MKLTDCCYKNVECLAVAIVVYVVHEISCSDTEIDMKALRVLAPIQMQMEGKCNYNCWLVQHWICMHRLRAKIPRSDLQFSRQLEAKPEIWSSIFVTVFNVPPCNVEYLQFVIVR